MSKSDNAIETERARQAHFIEWCQKKQMTDVCGNQLGWMRIIACYGKDLMLGTNWNNKNELRSKTVRGYFNAVNNLFLLRDFSPPVNFDDKQNMAAVIVHNLEREEDIATQRKPITMEMFAEIIKRGNASSASQETKLLASIAKLAKVIGPRSSEYAQKTISKVDCHEYPSGKTVIKAWIRKDYTFYDNKNRVIKTFNQKTKDRVAKVTITWRIQKNRRNGQKITVVRDYKNSDICPVLAALEIYMNSIAKGQPEDQPMAATLDTKGNIRYLSNGRIATLLRSAARKVHPDLSEDEIKQYSSHSFRVFACVLLDEAGVKPDMIKSRLRWMGDSYRLYLRDTARINQQHNRALEKASAEVMTLLSNNIDNLLVEEVPEADNSMGEYVEFD